MAYLWERLLAVSKRSKFAFLMAPTLKGLYITVIDACGGTNK